MTMGGDEATKREFRRLPRCDDGLQHAKREVDLGLIHGCALEKEDL